MFIKQLMHGWPSKRLGLRVLCVATALMTLILWSVWRAGPTMVSYYSIFQKATVTDPWQPSLAHSDTLKMVTNPRRAPLAHKDALVEFFPDWTTADPHDAVPVKRVYLYSATLAIQQTPPTGSHIRITAFKEKEAAQLRCCLRHHGNDTSVPALVVHSNKNNNQQQVLAAVYQCHVPFSPQDLTGVRVTMTPDSTCPVEENYYLPVYIPEVVKGGLAICGKVAFGSLLDPLKLVEWFEMQKLLGVDKIQILDFGNSLNVTKVFRYYQDTGLLAMFPFKVPGRPWGRGFTDETRVLYQLSQDEDFSILECRLRLAGYDYVMGIDMDEIIIPRKMTALKPYFQETFGPNPSLAAVYFHVQFFVEEFGPEDKDAPLHVLRYLKSTPARWECQKYTYMPARADQGSTHGISPYPGFVTKRVAPEEAVIHHYRHCPHGWPACTPAHITDKSITRFQADLVPRVNDVLSRIGI